jgi:ribosome-associated toxin RatA of RatAB toxin-antitoxin module
MTSVERSALVHRPARLLYGLVADIEKYPEFLPWCSAARIEETQGLLVQATVELDFRGIRQRFTTRNLNTPFESISLELVKGPFGRLDGRWRFTALADDACKIELAMHYEFARGPLKGVVGPVFGQIANTLVDSFVRRAEALRGPVF